MRFFIFGLFLSSFPLLAQQASFFADTTYIEFGSQNQGDVLKIREAQWQIKGKTLRYGSAPIFVDVEDELDTIFYKRFNSSAWDTLICHISAPDQFVFRYNTCCGGFDVYKNDKRIQASVIFENENPSNEHLILGTLGEGGAIIPEGERIRLTPHCRSVMSPNVIPLSLSQIEICSAENEDAKVVCLFKPGFDLDYEFSYRVAFELLNCLFLPLSDDPVRIVFDGILRKVLILPEMANDE